MQKGLNTRIFTALLRAGYDKDNEHKLATVAANIDKIRADNPTQKVEVIMHSCIHKEQDVGHHGLGISTHITWTVLIALNNHPS